MIKKLLPSVKGYVVQTILAPLTIILEVLFEVFIPSYMSKIIDEGITPMNLDGVYTNGIIIIVMAILSLACGMASARFSAVASAGFAKNTRQRLFAKVQDFSFYNVDRFSTASLVTRLTTDVNYVQNSFIMCIRAAFRAPLMFIMATVMAISINAKLSLVLIIIIPVVLIAVAVMVKVVFPLFERMFKKFDAMNSRVQENLTAIRVVKAFVREGHETQEFRKASLDVQKAQKKAEKIMIFATPMAMGTMYACMLMVLWFGGNDIIKGSMSEGDLTAFITYITQILTSIMMVTMVVVTIVMSQASAKRITDVLSEEIDIKDDNADENIKVDDGSIEFKDVAFSYSKKDDNLIIDNFNLKINSGETVGIIGATGSAKSTIVQLILRLYDVNKGAVFVGGHDVRDYKLKNLRDGSAMVLQKNVLFSGTIKDNLKWGNPDATDDDIREACEIAMAHEFISSFPDGYDTELGQGGVNVSGGQKQRLCIARALLRKPKIMILDDSTSAVDTATDAKIRKGLKDRLSGTTVIIIAQRLNSIMDADKIVVLDEGKISSCGTHNELMENSEIYKEIFDSQQKGVE